MKAIRTVLACIRKADQTYNLINKKDKIVIGLSGGKDSVALTYTLNLYKKFSHTDFIIQPVVLDLGFPGFDYTPLRDFCSSLGLDLIVYDATDVYKILQIQQEKQGTKHLPCSICSRMKKAAINKVCKEIGFNKVAFAHHIDDAIETLFMNEIHGGRIATFSPKMHLEKADVEFIRPLILTHEKDILALIKEENLPIIDSKCPSDKNTTREEIKNILKNLYHNYPNAISGFENMLSNYEQEDIWTDQIYMQINQNGLTIHPVVNANDGLLFAKINLENIKNNEIFDNHNFLICQNKETIGTISYKFLNGEYLISNFKIIDENINKTEIIDYFSNFIAGKFNPCKIAIYSEIDLEPLNFIEDKEKFQESGINLKKFYKSF